ncbi:DNA-formamidopyrimidine glycosylase [Candidatus Roizmanbacteria bacterium]|nr:DNA-formamidopyrimidine glycosylase [Candidatus Roizmanbacteria bacterium]
MPELPEVETIRRALIKNILHKKIKDVEIFSPKQFHGDITRVGGAKITGLRRKGKVLYLELANGLYLNFHLKMSGELLFGKKRNVTLKEYLPRTGTKSLPNKHTRIILNFDDGSALFFNDLRLFGWIKLTNKPAVPGGVDVLSKEFTAPYLLTVGRSTTRPIKILLMDQEKIAGIGNIYANDSLWEAKINPLRKAKTLTEVEINNLYKAIKKIIAEAIKYKGSSAQDEMYVMPDGQKGKYQNHFRVYHRTGKPCFRDKKIIVAIRMSGRGTFYCPTCQI